MTAYGFRKEPGSPEWMIFRKELKSIRGVRQWATRLGFNRLIVWDQKKYIGLFRSPSGILNVFCEPISAVPTSLLVRHKNGNINEQQTLAALQEYARD